MRDDLDRALGIVNASIDQSRSHAIYSLGSFGGGNSHFKVVLTMLTANQDSSGGIPELCVLRDKHPWGQPKGSV